MRCEERLCRRSTHPDEPLLPPDAEHAFAAGAAHRVRRAFQLHAVATAGAHSVFVAPLRGQASRIMRAGDDRPVLGRCCNDLQGRARHRDLLPVDVEPRLSGRQIRHPVPRTTAHSTVHVDLQDRKSTRLNSSHVKISYAVFCLKKKKKKKTKKQKKKKNKKKNNERIKQLT